MFKWSINLIRIILLLILFSFSTSIFAGLTESILNVKITGLSTHDGATATYIYLVLSDGSVAFINAKNKELHSLPLSAFMAEKTIAIHRYNQGINGSGDFQF